MVHEYEVDHIIPLELGGADTEKNLRPQAGNRNLNGYDASYHVKDQLENELHTRVCAGRLDLFIGTAGIALFSYSE